GARGSLASLSEFRPEGAPSLLSRPPYRLRGCPKALVALYGRRTFCFLRIKEVFPRLDMFWRRDESREDSDSLPDPDVLAQEIVEGLEVASSNSAQSPPTSLRRGMHRRTMQSFAVTQTRLVGYPAP